METNNKGYQPRPEFLNKDQADELLQDKLIEDTLINSFIREEVGINISPGLAVDSKYAKSKTDKKYIYDRVSFEYFNEEYEKFQSEHPRLEGISFENFVKLHNPSRQFIDELRVPVPKKNSPAFLYDDVYNQDLGVMRHSALNGYKLKLEDRQDEVRRAG